jgi:hypothetical protein
LGSTKNDRTNTPSDLFLILLSPKDNNNNDDDDDDNVEEDEEEDEEEQIEEGDEDEEEEGEVRSFSLISFLSSSLSFFPSNSTTTVSFTNSNAGVSHVYVRCVVPPSISTFSLLCTVRVDTSRIEMAKMISGRDVWQYKMCDERNGLL